MSTCPNEPICKALRNAGLALSASNGLHVTDRPDLPREQWPVWVLDHARELAAIDRAERALHAATQCDCRYLRPANKRAAMDTS